MRDEEKFMKEAHSAGEKGVCASRSTDWLCDCL